MNWTDLSLILDLHPLGEGHARVTVLSKHHGLYNGFVRGVRAKQNQAALHRGNLVEAQWQARLEDQLGQFKLDLKKPYGTLAILERAQLEAMNLMCAMLLSCLDERQSFIPIFEASLVLLENLEDPYLFAVLYQKWELGLLERLGFGLDLEKCVDTGRRDQLTHISPKSGKAVCRDSAEPYKNKLLALPNHLLVDDEKPTISALLSGFTLTGFFIEKWILAPKNQTIPPARTRFLDRFAKLDRMEQI